MGIKNFMVKIKRELTGEARKEAFLKAWAISHPEPDDAGIPVICELYSKCNNFYCISHYPHAKSSFCRDHITHDSYCTNEQLGNPFHICIPVPDDYDGPEPNNTEEYNQLIIECQAKGMKYP